MRASVVVGFVVVALLCGVTALEFISNRAAFPLWFSPVFLAGLVGLIGLMACYVRWLLAASPPLRFRQGASVHLVWALLPVSFLCTSSVHGFYPFRIGFLESDWPISTVLKFNFLLTASGLVVTLVLAALYRSGWRRVCFWSLLVLAGVLLIPNDDCGNAFNRSWIRQVGASPLMFVPNVVAILFAASALFGTRPIIAVFAIIMVCLSTLALGIGHMTRVLW